LQEAKTIAIKKMLVIKRVFMIRCFKFIIYYKAHQTFVLVSGLGFG